MRWKRSSAHTNSVTRERNVPECKKVQAEGKRAVGVVSEQCINVKNVAMYLCICVYVCMCIYVLMYQRIRVLSKMNI